MKLMPKQDTTKNCEGNFPSVSCQARLTQFNISLLFFISYAKPILTDPENCVAILNKENCQIEVKRKDNTRTVCEIESWIA